MKSDKFNERRESMGTIEELLKRKRDEIEEKNIKDKGRKEEEEKWAFRRSKKLLRSLKEVWKSRRDGSRR